MATLDLVADRQACWSVSANKLKQRIDRARWGVFALSIVGALLAAIASQIKIAGAHTGLALLGAVGLAAATFVSQRLLGRGQVAAWVRARAISEALKGEAYKFATGASPYDVGGAAAEQRLDAERTRIEAEGEDLVPELVEAAGQGSAPRCPLTVESYVEQRVRRQIAWYLSRKQGLSRTAMRLKWAEFSLALAATIITAAASALPPVRPGVPFFDIACLTAVLTTIAGAVLTHIEAARYDFVIATYMATARRLEDRLGRGNMPAVVADCEAIIAMENGSWAAKWMK